MTDKFNTDEIKAFSPEEKLIVMITAVTSEIGCNDNGSDN
jgi:hypothetical protein